MLLLLAIATTTRANYTVKEVAGNIYVEEISKVYLFDDNWHLIIGINTTSNEQRLRTVDTTIQQTKTACNRECTPKDEVQLVRSMYDRLVLRNNILTKLLEKQVRSKRGLANFVGNISKPLFGTLSETDLKDINAEFDHLYMDNKNLSTVITNPTRILKMLLDFSSTNHKLLLGTENEERQIARNLSTSLNALSCDSFVNSKLVLAAFMSDETAEDLDMEINAINNCKHGIVHLKILTPTILKNTIE